MVFGVADDTVFSAFETSYDAHCSCFRSPVCTVSFQKLAYFPCWLLCSVWSLMVSPGWMFRCSLISGGMLIWMLPLLLAAVRLNFALSLSFIVLSYNYGRWFICVSLFTVVEQLSGCNNAFKPEKGVER